MNIDNFDWGKLNEDPVKSVIEEEIFTRNSYHKHFLVNEGDIVVDIGASVGPFTYSILDKKPKHVFCLEPSKIEFPTLVKNTLGHPVSCINKAIHSGNGITDSIQVYLDKSNVETITFKSFVELYGINYIDFLKIDCESGEYDIFVQENINYLQNNVKVMVVEFHLNTPLFKNKFRYVRDNFLNKFKNFHVYSIDEIDIKWNLHEESFIQYYNQIMVHIDNRVF